MAHTPTPPPAPRTSTPSERRAQRHPTSPGGPPAQVIDANQATAHVAFRASEVIAIYPITPSSPMGEHADAWAAQGQRNLWGAVPSVTEMQAEGGAAGALHGALQGGALATTFTASQGLLLMLPNMFKIAGELTPTVFHIAARSVATHALSIFGDHSDVYACRSAGWGMLLSGSPQEAHDLALVAHAATLKSRIPFLHVFDGFRTSHELQRVELVADEAMRDLLDPDAMAAHRRRALSPDHPVVRGTAHNPDTFFQAREATNPWYDACPRHVEETMEAFASAIGRRYHLFDYVGHPEAERVIVMMGSGAETAHETVEWMVERGEKVGLVKVRLYRPWSAEHLRAALPDAVKTIAVLDRTKEPGAPAEPLHLDVIASLAATSVQILGGRYGLSSKEFDPAMVVRIFEELGAAEPKPQFTVGLVDDVTHLSLDHDPDLDIEPDDVFRGVFYGLGSDGTVGACKSSIKILAECTGGHAQGYFVYDSKKSGAMTISHLRASPRPIRSTYLISTARFVGVHQWAFLDRLDVLETCAPGGTLLLNAPYPAGEVFGRLPQEAQQAILDKELEVWAVDASRIAREAGLGRRINTVMQVAFFHVSDFAATDEAIDQILAQIQKTYGKKGDEVVRRNTAAVRQTETEVRRVPVPAEATSTRRRRPIVAPEAPDDIQRLTAVMLARQGDRLPVSAFPPDGTWPTGTSQWEKRGIAHEIPVWDEAICIQCNKCALICPHAAIRTKAFPAGALALNPTELPAVRWKGKELPDHSYSVQVAPDDCTGCGLCVAFCPAKDKSNPRHKAIDMGVLEPIAARERARYSAFLALPEVDREVVASKLTVKSSQLLEPLFEYSGACAGCGETPYIKLATQLFGDRMVIANATGCSSIFGGNMPTTPYTTDREGRGPAWSNSLFEDNAEFGLGMRLSIDQHAAHARTLVRELQGAIGVVLSDELVESDARDEAGIVAQRERVRRLHSVLGGIDDPRARELESLANYLVHHSVWIVGGDGWAYDIGYGGLDHVLASGRDVNVLVLDTEVYSNTGGQASKATPIGAVAKFAAAGKSTAKKDLGLMTIPYGNVYVARIAIGASDKQTVKAMQEAASWPGPSLLIAYSPCIAHGFDLRLGAQQQRRAVDCGYWPLYRYDPRADEGKGRLFLDSRRTDARFEDYAYQETRYRMLKATDPGRARALLKLAKEAVDRSWEAHKALAERPRPSDPADAG